MDRPELGSPGPGLRARMIAALAVNFVLVGALVAALLWPLTLGADGWKLTAFVVLTLLAGLTVERRRPAGFRGERQPTERDEQRIRAIADRLALGGGLTTPEIVVARSRIPLSWTTSAPWSEPKLHATTGLVDLLDDERLAAVVAHELGHVANRDATLMTLIAWPSTLMWGALRRAGSEALGFDARAACAFVLMAPFFTPLAALFTLSGRIVARHRELAADRAAAVLTGSPAGVSAALLAVGDGLVRMPRKDLRRVAARDPFHFVPARPARGLRRLWATHPPVERRLRELDRLERMLQAG